MATKTVFRTARVVLRTTRAQRQRAVGVLVAAGDVWAWVLDCNREIRSWGDRPVVSYEALCHELTGMQFGELSVVAARSVLRRYADAWFAAAKRRAAGEPAGFPRRKRRVNPVSFYRGTFTLDGGRVWLPMARGAPALWLRFARELPYPAELVRSVTLLYESGQLVLAVTAELPVQHHRTGLIRQRSPGWIWG